MLLNTAKVFYRYLYSIVNVNNLLSHGFANKLPDLDISKVKTSDTLFILGSGASVNDFTDRQWEEIGKHDSIGINYWVIHEFVPRYLMFELPFPPRDKYFFDALEFRKEKYKNVPIIFKGLYRNRSTFGDFKSLVAKFPSSLLKNMYLGKEFAINAKTKDEFAQTLNRLNKIGFFRARKRMRTLAQHRGTISCAIIFGIKSGYKKIVLCGVELNNDKYFYSERSEYYKSLGIVTPETGQVGANHLTNTALSSAIPISHSIFMMKDFFKENYKIDLEVAITGSVLYPELNLYNWQS
ncbi:MAG: hypothetical protein EOP51_06505 [Sphingobacteriales bacterium]|nr:MAG: hypothetical protein EOP51_06505 [Sphingobacteriales bacterium]